MAIYRIMVIEDLPAHFELVRRFLERLEMTNVVHAKDGSEALNILNETDQKFHLIISDHNMPNMSGLEFLEKMSLDRRHSGTPFILMAAEKKGELAVRAQDAGATWFISKPFSLERFETMVKDALIRREPQV